MTKRIEPSALQNSWHDAQRVDRSDLNVEQERNNQIDAAIINNHFGSGVLPFAPEQPIIFDSDNLDEAAQALWAAHDFDGSGIQPSAQPSDIALGNQLEIELTDSALDDGYHGPSTVFGRLCTKVAIIGLAFDGSMQMDRLYFYKKEKQVTSKHYKTILAIFFNDFFGNNNCSRNNGGRIVIRETLSFQFSRDPIMVAQDVEPDIFWRDWKKASLAESLFTTIQNGIGAEYSADGLNINVTGRPNRTLVADDVVSQVGQKFMAKTNNIQKVTLLLGVEQNSAVAEEDYYDWTGDLVISIYALQTTVNSPTDLVPGLAIDFTPANEPLAQISYSQATLQDAGYVLTDILQPVDFVFNSTKVGAGNIVPGKFYAVTLRRSGAATNGTIIIGCGNDRVEDSRTTLFSGVWVDAAEEDLWFQIWTDAAKVADGQGYDAGNGIVVQKTKVDSSTGAVIDNQYGQFSFASTGENIQNIALVQAIVEESVTVQDERTGNDVYSRKKFVPSFSFVSTSGLADLRETSDPLIIGAIQDTNPKQNANLEKIQLIPGLANGDSFCILNPDADLLSLNLLGSKLVPNVLKCDDTYRIFKVTLCTDGYGDVNGDGSIDSEDIVAASNLLGESLYFESTQQKIIDGYFTTFELLRADVNGDGYVTTDDVDLITQYVNRETNGFPAGSSFTHLCLQVQQSIGRYDGYFDCNGYVRLDGYGGINIVAPGDLTDAELVYDGYITDSIINIDPVFSTVPFPGVTYQIKAQPFWQPYLLGASSDVRLVPAAFTSQNALVPAACTAPVTFECEDRNDVVPAYDPGRNDFMVPDNFYIKNGEILRPDGNHYKVDFEIGTIILKLPQVPLNESAINVFDKFVADRGDGFTRAGFRAMRYASCETVQDEDLSLGRVRFGVSLQAFMPNLDGYDSVDGYAAILDGMIGVYMNQTNGILKLTMRDLLVDPLYMTLVTKIQIQVFLKKGGWNNQVLEVEPSEIVGLISS